VQAVQTLFTVSSVALFMGETLSVQKRERLSNLLGMFLRNWGKGEMRSFITPETFTAFMQNLKFKIIK